MSIAIAQSVGRRVASALRPFDKLVVSWGDEDTYRRFRILEPSLVSCVDQHSDSHDTTIEYLMIKCMGEVAGIASLVTRVNTHRPPHRSLYGRIDLVIVHERFRGLGLGRVLTLVSVTHLLETFDSRLYSISCLAAHPAMEKILDSVGFVRREQGEKNYVHEELAIDPTEVGEFRDRMVSETKAAARRANFNIRQRQNER